jgi:hypothetical protein
MGAAGFSETLVSIYQTTQHYIPEDHSFNIPIHITSTIKWNNIHVASH